MGKIKVSQFISRSSWWFVCDNRSTGNYAIFLNCSVYFLNKKRKFTSLFSKFVQTVHTQTWSVVLQQSVVDTFSEFICVRVIIIYFTPCIRRSPMNHFRRYQNIYLSLHRALLLVSLLKSGARCRSLNSPLQLSSNSEPAIVVIVALWIVCPKSLASYCQSIMYDVDCIMYTSLQYLLHTVL